MSRNKHYSDHYYDVDQGINFFKGAILATFIGVLLWAIIILLAVNAYSQSRYTYYGSSGIKAPRFDATSSESLGSKNETAYNSCTTTSISVPITNHVFCSGKVSFYHVHIHNRACLRVRICGKYTPLKHTSVAHPLQKSDPLDLSSSVNHFAKDTYV